MSRRVIQVLLTLGACSALSCDRPTEPTLGPTGGEAPPARFAIVDAVHQSGNPYFFFLSPLVADPTSGGTFDATVLGSLAVDVCALGASGCAGAPIKHFTSSSGTTLERIRVDAARKYFLVYWNTGESVVDPAKNYRIRVLSGIAPLALIDVDVVPNAAALTAVDRAQFAGVVKGDWLPIRFRIDQGALTYNSPPTVTISAPTNGTHFKQGASITFTGVATDAQDGDLSAQIQWKADSTLVLGTGASVSATLPVGAHVVTASVTDSRGAGGQATVNLVVDANQPPTATISAPANGTTVSPGTAVAFSGSGTDPEDGTLGDASLAWSSSLDGALGTGTTVTKSNLSAGVHTITLTATDSKGASGTAAITLTVGQPPASQITLPATLSVPYVHDVTLPVQLSQPAPAGGVTVSLASSDPARVGVSTPTVTIPAGATSGSGTLHGAAPGTATITASGAGYAAGTSTVTTTAQLRLVGGSVSVGTTLPASMTVQLQSAGAAMAAPPTGITVNLISNKPTCARPQAPVATIAAGSVSAIAIIQYGGSAPVPCSARIYASAAAVGGDSATAMVSAPGVALPAGTTPVGSGLVDGLYGAHLDIPAGPGGVVVHISSDDSTLVLVSSDFDAIGRRAIDVTVAAGRSDAYFAIQGMEGRTGQAKIRLTAPGYAAGSEVITVVQPSFDLRGLPASLTSAATNVPFTVRVGVAYSTSADSVEREQSIRAGGVARVATISNSAATVAQLITFGPSAGQTGTITIDPGNATSNTGGAPNHGIEFDPLGTGITTVTASIPGWHAFAGATRAVRVSSTTLAFSDQPYVGSGLQAGGHSIRLSPAAPAGGVTVHIAASDGTLLLLSPNASTPGTGSLDVGVAAGSDSVSFYVQGLESRTGTSLIRAGAAGYPTDSVVATVMQPGAFIFWLGLAPYLRAPNSPFALRLGIGYPNNPSMQWLEQAIRAGGGPVTFTVTNSAPAVARLLAPSQLGQSITTTILPGQSLSPTGGVAGGGMEFQPLALGTTTVRVTGPGFYQFGSGSVTVTTVPIVYWGSPRVGSGLQATSYFQLGMPAPAGTVVHLTSSNPGVLLLAANPSAAGAGSIDIPVFTGSYTAHYWAQGVEGRTGTVTISASAAGFRDTSATAIVETPLISLNGPGSTSVGAGNQQFQAIVGIADTSQASTIAQQPTRPGGAPFTVTVTNSAAGVGRLVSSGPTFGQVAALQIGAGQSQTPMGGAAGHGVEFQPLAAGNTIVSVTAPGFLPGPNAVRHITVSP